MIIETITFKFENEEQQKRFHRKLDGEENVPFPPTGRGIKCPFCGEDDFDLVGLKRHYERARCQAYLDTDPQTF